MNFVTLLSVSLLFLISLFAFVSPTSAKAKETAWETPPTSVIHIIFLKRGNSAEIRSIGSFATEGGLGTTRITAEAQVRGNRLIINLPDSDPDQFAYILHKVKDFRIISPMRLSPELSKKLGQKGPITLKAGKFTDMDQVKEKNMLWFEIQ